MAQIAVGLVWAAVASFVWSACCANAVTRRRLAKFAVRQQLAVTSDNGPLLITYLAVTRRWRGAGLLAGVVIGGLYSSRHTGVNVGYINMLAGWFAGAVAAEWRLTRHVEGHVRAAALSQRMTRDYLPTYWRMMPTLALAASGATIAWVAAFSRVDLPRVTVIAAVAAVLVATVKLVQRRVLQRPQPLGDADVIAADDAIRSRSLHVLVGSATTLALTCLTWEFHTIGSTSLDGAAGATSTIGALAGLLAPILGIMIATDTWHVRRRLHDERPTASATS